ncbi:MAG: acetolactate synthase small subunit [Bacillota bacterium]|jgi:acetolactate synthase-1/3 small subunit|nr:acetolactate synthase small subunit [Bacillota bacterium]HOB91288.1 acetolactate synthase small subunit [Bacillota bacterium]HPZ53693.1 acetolactate synthase small subunit [Bacillota bacterium]HQD17946.1 acetolactate synthase small subunit [Bacillota bacterium]
MKRTLSVLVNNRSGVLARVASLFSRRGYNIESIAVGVTDDPEVSRMTIQVIADEATFEQITKQLHKLIDVIKISDITSDERVDRELALIRISADSSNRSDILQVVGIFRAKIVDVAEKSIIVEVTGDEGKIDAFVQLARPYGIIEIVRTGKVSMVRGSK